MHDSGWDVTTLLSLAAGGDSAAQNDLMNLVYQELRDVATNKLRDEGSETSLTPTILVHEAYERVMLRACVKPTNRRHLFFAFARAMWQLVVEHKRTKRLPQTDAAVDFLVAVEIPDMDAVLDLNDALDSLRQAHPRCYEVAILRKALGFTQRETAALLDASPATIKRDWVFAKAWLVRRMACGER